MTKGPSLTKRELSKLHDLIGRFRNENIPEWAKSHLQKASELYPYWLPVENADVVSDITRTSNEIGERQAFIFDQKEGQHMVLMSFRLCYRKDKEYHYAILNVRNKRKTRFKRIQCPVLPDNNKTNWGLVGVDVKVDVDQCLEYQYGLIEKSYLDVENLETSWRSLSTITDVYDVFHPPSVVPAVFTFGTQIIPCTKSCGTCSYGSFFHVRTILPTIHEQGLKSSILAAEKTGFPSTKVDKNFVSGFISWMENTLATLNPTDNVSAIFITILLAKVVRAAEEQVYLVKFKPATLDKISEALSSCDMGDLPSATLDSDVELICTRTVQGLNETFIYLWQNFSNILSVKKLEKISHSLRKVVPSDNTKLALESALAELLDKPSYSSSLITRTIKEIQDVDSLFDVIQVMTINPKLAENPDVNIAMAYKFEVLNEAKKSDWVTLGSHWDAALKGKVAGLTDAVRNLIVRYLRRETWSIPNKSLESLLLDPKLFKKEDFLDVMEILLKLKTQCVQLYQPQKLFIDIMEEPEFWKLLEPNEIRNLLEKAIQSISSVSCTCHKLHIEDKIKMALQMQQVMHSCEHFRSVTSWTDSIIEKTLKKIRLLHLFQFMKTAMCTGFQEINLLTKHICGRLIQEKSIRQHSNDLKNVLYGKDGTWTRSIDSEHLACVLETLIDVTCCKIFKKDTIQKISPDEVYDFESCFEKLLEHSDLLTMALNVEPNSKYTFQEHVGLKIVKVILKKVPEIVNRGDITMHLFDKICDDQRVPDMIHSLGYPFKEEWKPARNKAMKFRETFVNYMSSFERLTRGTISYVLETINVMDAEHILEEVNKRSQDFYHTDTRKLSEADNPEYWGTLYPLLTDVDALSPVAYSEIFLNVCRLHFTKKMPNLDVLQTWKKSSKKKYSKRLNSSDSCVDTDEDDTKTTSMNYAEFVQILSKECLVNYRKYGLILETQGLSVPVYVVQDILDGIKSEEQMRIELELLSEMCSHDLSDIAKPVKSLIILPDISQKAQQLTSVLSTFEFKDNQHPIYKALKTISELSKRTTVATLTLPEVDNAVSEIIKRTKEISEVGWNIISQLTRAKELINFLRTILHEDLRNLIDAVEERSDQNVDEYTVSALIDVKQHLIPLLRQQPSDQPKKLINAIKQVMHTVDNGDIFCTKINTCVHNVYALNDLFNNVANRGEVTREKIRNALREGVYEFEMDSMDGTWKAQMTYERRGKRGTYDLDALNDLQSRALLIVHSQKQHQQFQHQHHPQDSIINEEEKIRPVDYDLFIKNINTVNEIVKLCISLVAAGHFEFRNFRTCTGEGKTLQDILKHLQKSSTQWHQDVDDARTKFYFLNFFQSKQLSYLDQFFASTSDVTNEISLLFRFLNPNVVVDENIRDKYALQEGTNVQKRLLHLGQILDDIMKNHTTVDREIMKKHTTVDREILSEQDSIHEKHTTVDREILSEQDPIYQTESRVTRGIVFVAELELRSSKALHVLMQLYKNTSGFFPEPSQVLFCNSNTTWEEIFLLLQRCKGASNHFPDRKLLYAIVHAEQLQTESQLKLISEVKKLQDDSKGFLLAVICCGGRYHHIIDQFTPKYTHSLNGFDTAALQACFKEGWKVMPTCQTLQSNSPVTSVTFLTSTQPGLGKTEYVKRMASTIKCGVNTMLVAGPITKQGLIEQLKRQSTKKHCILHLDCAEVSDCDLFDCFVFEMVVVGMSVSGTSMCVSPSSVVILEIGNTQRGKLQNSLPICSAFPNKHIQWSGSDDFVVSEDPNSPLQVVGLDDFVVSEDPNSPVQVVCHYLKALNDKTLDKRDITFVGPKKISPLSESECHTILKKHFSSDTGLSYSFIVTFLGLFSKELRRMSASTYFTSTNIETMVKTKFRGQLRSNLVREIMTVCKTFSSRSVDVSQTDEISSHTAAEIAESRLTTGVSAESLVARMKHMIMWHDTNHLFLVFHQQDSQSVTPVYRNRSKVPGDIEHLFQTQMGGLDQLLPDYNKMSHPELQRELEKLVCKNLPFNKTKLKELQTRYALTPDNFLKMVLIYIRIQAQTPVIIMGETGCGKTSLVMYLARVCDVPFKKLSLHAGVTEDMIVNFVNKIKRTASHTEHTWVFFDEINTCDHLGLLNEIVCHHRCKGVYIPPNMVFIAACNPYRLREDVGPSAGLETDKTRDERSKLVYRVHPLPETMMEFVWDYGALSEEDEGIYIKQMIGKEQEKEAFVDLVVESQRFMRQHKGNSHCVSLRDVNRCKHLQHHFEEMFRSKNLVIIPGSHSTDFVNRTDIRSTVLALCHCYHSRLSIAEDRRAYRQIIADNLARQNGLSTDKINEQFIYKMIECEQSDLLKRMSEKPPGTALNEALRENVFVMLVSILNKIPVFVVGKPGCSKSLAMQLIRSNLRGRDSTDKYFKKLPPIYTISFQGSKSSTSEGIIKVFEKAKRYKDYNANVIPVVLLDEIGLAELSEFNPLKVLHSQLEPVVGEFPPVAVVGISNRALDPAKMNRAVHLSRPDPTELDLEKTAQLIRRSVKRESHPAITKTHIKGLAKAYYDYQVHQPNKHFHGLRDYYSFIKLISSASDRDPASIVINGLRRNFGGMQSGIVDVLNTFLGKVRLSPRPSNKPNVMKLITDNIDDPDARHLLLITRGDSALNILEQTLQGREHKIIYGSKFENDRTEQYKYQVLSEIILCMEQGLILVKRDLDCIYESLYDMLNQSYTVVGRKRNCRVAVGAYSNPMCQVHDRFRCIVIVDEKKLNMADPPFLNRFEKQTLTFSEVLSPVKEKMVDTLRRWISDLNTEETPCDADEIFLGFSADSLSSLVCKHLANVGDQVDEIQANGIIGKSKDDLLKTACPDAILRLTKAKLNECDTIQVAEIQRTYFALPIHDGFRHFVQERSRLYRNTKVIVYTHSSIHFDMQRSIADLPVQVDKLSNFKSHLDLSNRLLQFWKSDSKASLLVLQCMPSLDAPNMTLAKCCIDGIQREYLRSENGNLDISKSICIVVHLDRFQSRNQDNSWRFNFLCGWDQFTIDSLDSATPVMRDIYVKGRISEVLYMKGVEWQKIVDAKMLLWCFNCIKYTENSRSVDNSLQLVQLILQSKEVMELLKTQIPKYLKKEEISESSTETWQMEIASNRELLMTWSTLVGAMLEHIRHCVRQSLAKVIIALEESNAWNGICVEPGTDLTLMPRDQETHNYWKVCFNESGIFNNATLYDPRGSETYPLARSLLDLKYPFFNVFKSVLDSHYQSLVTGMILHTSMSYEDSGKDFIQLQLVDLISRIPKVNHDRYLTNHLDEFIYDLFNVFSEPLAPNFDADLRVEILRLLLTYTQRYSDTETGPFHKITQVYLLIQRNYQLLSAEFLMISQYNKTGRDIKGLLEALRNVQNQVNDNDMPDQSKMESENVSLDSDNIVSKAREDHPEMTDDDDESVSDSNDDGNNDEYHTTNDNVHAILVIEICKAHLPFKETLEHFGGIKHWQQTTNFVLNLAKQVTSRTSILTCGKMSSRVSIFHFLSLCRDFATFIISMKLIDQDKLLLSLADLALHTDFMNVLDNEGIFEYLAQQMESARDMKNKRIPEEFMSMSFNLSLEANLDTPLLGYILESLCLESGNSTKGSRPVLHNILGGDIEGNRNICEEIISDGMIDEEDYPNMCAVDKILQRIDEESSFSVICCDIIEEEAFSDLSSEKMRDVISRDDKVLKTATKSAQIVFGTKRDDKSSMQYVCAGAFLRAFIKCVGKLFHRTSNHQLFLQNEKHHVLGTSVCSILSQAASNQPSASGLLLYLVKCMAEYNNLFEACEWLQHVPQPLQYLDELEFQPQLRTSRLGYNPLSYMTNYSKVMGALSEWLEHGNDRELTEVLDIAKSDIDYQLGIVSAVSEVFYWPHTTTEIRNTDQLKMRWLVTKISETLSDQCQHLLHRLLASGVQNDFLDITSSTDVRKLHQISLVLHAACLLISEESHISLDVLDTQTSDSQSDDYLSSVFRFDCQCGFSLFCKEIQTTCSICHRDLEDTKPINQSDITSEPVKHTSMIQMILAVISDSLYIVRLLFCSGGTGPKTPDSDSSEVIPSELLRTDAGDVAQTRHDTLKDNWLSLADMLEMNLKDVSLLLHSVLYTIIKGSRSTRTLPFQEFVRLVITKILVDPNRHMKEYQHICFKAQEVQEHSIEFQVEELPSQQSESLHSLKPRLFRKRRCPTFQDFEMKVFKSTRGASDFPFLRLFLCFKEPLQYVRHLPILLRWIAAISRQLGHSIMRIQAKEMKVSTLLDESKSMKHLGETTSDIFDDFQKAWNDISGAWKALTGSDEELPTMTLARPVMMCIMTTSVDYSPLHNVVRVLQNVQNGFLQNVLSVASSVYSPSLNFLVKEDGVSTIQRVSLDNARKEIIKFEWSDKIRLVRRNCDIGIDYGQGHSVEYNFIVIERALARLLVMNKALLTDGTVFTQIVFSDELIHASSSVLADISAQIPQEALSKDVLESLNRKIRDRKEFANELLENLEIMFVLLKKTSGEPQELLISYITKWSTQLPGSFSSDILPEPSSIRLCHIEALYRELENQLADGYINCLESRFKLKLPKPMIDDMKLCLEGSDVDQMQSALMLLRLFTFRYLRPSKNVMSDTCKTSLIEVIRRSTLGTMDVSALAELIPDDVCVRHIFKLQEFIASEIQQHQSKTEPNWWPTSHSTHEKGIFPSTPKPTNTTRNQSRKKKGKRVAKSSESME